MYADLGTVNDNFFNFTSTSTSNRYPSHPCIHPFDPRNTSSLMPARQPASPLAQPWSVIAGNTFSALVGVVFGYLPARKAARLNPIEALRAD